MPDYRLFVEIGVNGVSPGMVQWLVERLEDGADLAPAMARLDGDYIKVVAVWNPAAEPVIDGIKFGRGRFAPGYIDAANGAAGRRGTA